MCHRGGKQNVERHVLLLWLWATTPSAPRRFESDLPKTALFRWGVCESARTGDPAEKHHCLPLSELGRLPAHPEGETVAFCEGKCQALQCCGKGRWSWPAEKRIGFSASVTKHATTAKLAKKNGPCAATARPSVKPAAPASWRSWPRCWSALHATTCILPVAALWRSTLAAVSASFPQFQTPWNFNPYHRWTPHFPHQHLLQTPPPPPHPNYPWWP